MDRAGLDGTALLVRADRDADRIDTAISVHEASQEQAGHSGTLWFSKESRFWTRPNPASSMEIKQSGLRTRT